MSKLSKIKCEPFACNAGRVSTTQFQHYKLFNYCNCYYTNNLLLLRTYLEIIYYYCRTKTVFLIVELKIRFIQLPSRACDIMRKGTTSSTKYCSA